MTVLVDVDRERRHRLQTWAVLIAFPKRLLAVLDPELGELGQRVPGFLEAPVLVDVHLQRNLRHTADGAHALHVPPVPATELQLQAAERWGLRGTASPVVRIAEPQPPGGRRRR